MNPLIVLSAAVAGYFIGAVSMARIVTRIVSPATKITDTLEVGLEGSDKTLVLGTVSASWVSYNIGSKWGFLTYLLDMLKIVIPAVVIRKVWPAEPYFLVAAAAGVAGHIWPVYYRFRGGRGISAIYGGFLVIDWVGMLICSIGGMLLGLVAFRDVLTAYMAGVVLIIPWVCFRTHNPAIVIYSVIVNTFFVIAMLPEIRNWRRIKREEKWDDPVAVVQLSGMGRGMVKMGRKLGLIKKKSGGADAGPPVLPQ
jgi:acyl phosphate:glycerol-3-phosphate acyltransferase